MGPSLVRITSKGERCNLNPDTSKGSAKVAQTTPTAHVERDARLCCIEQHQQQREEQRQAKKRREAQRLSELANRKTKRSIVQRAQAPPSIFAAPRVRFLFAPGQWRTLVGATVTRVSPL